MNEFVKEENKNKNTKFVLWIIIIILIFLIVIIIERLGTIGTEETFTEDIIQISVSDNDINLTKNTELKIFNNAKFEQENMIAPGSNGIYTFYITNEGSSDLTYDIYFSDVLTSKVNIKYRIKTNNIYIRGNSEEYVDIEDINISDIIIQENSTDMFTLEWCWIDNDEEDTEVGILSTEENRQYYTLNVDILVKDYSK